MAQGMKDFDMTLGHKLLLETLAGHMALLQTTHPRKAKSAAARKAKQCVMSRLRDCNSRMRQAA
jgi:hypothetical protein